MIVKFDLKPYYFAGIIAVALAVFYFVAQSWNSQALTDSTDLLFIAVSGVCSILAFLVVRKWGFRGNFGLVHLGLFLGVFLWFVAETIWAVYEMVFHIEVPYPSIADAFYLAGYVPFFLGLVQFLVFFKGGLTRRRVVMLSLFILVLLSGSGLVLINLLMIESVDVLAKASDVIYAVLDSFLACLAVAVAMIFGKRRFGIAWLWIALGMLLKVTADLAFSYGTLVGWYYSGNPIELLYIWSYLSLGLGFAYQTRNLAS